MNHTLTNLPFSNKTFFGDQSTGSTIFINSLRLDEISPETAWIKHATRDPMVCNEVKVIKMSFLHNIFVECSFKELFNCTIYFSVNTNYTIWKKNILRFANADAQKYAHNHNKTDKLALNRFSYRLQLMGGYYFMPLLFKIWIPDCFM